MTDNYLTLWVQAAVNRISENIAKRAIQKTGRALPCKVTAVSGSLVTVSFQVTGIWTLPALQLPKAESQYLRSPTQVGDLGFTAPADTFLGGVSGQSSDTADLSVDYGNLATLVFFPIASTNFAATPDPNKAWVNGPHGAIIGDSASGVYAVFDSVAGSITFHVGAKSWTMTSAGLTMSSGIVAETHQHSGVTTGSGTSGPPIA